MEIKELIELKVKLVNVFLIEMPENIVDISFNVSKSNLSFQIVLINGTSLDNHYQCELEKIFENLKISISILYVQKNVFNKNRGGWLPNGYVWLDNILYSKAEIL